MSAHLEYIGLLRDQVEANRVRLERSEEELQAAIDQQALREHNDLIAAIDRACEYPTLRVPGTMKEFFLTTGAGYSPNEKTKHPIYPRFSGKGFIVVEAPTRAWAEALVWVHMGDKFSGLYLQDPSKTDMGRERYWYPAGEIGRISPEGVLTWNDDVWGALL